MAEGLVVRSAFERAPQHQTRRQERLRLDRRLADPV
jgi:hypothetical protein